MKPYLLVLLTYILLCSCSVKSKNEVQNSSISLLKNRSESINANTLFDEFEYIPLETTEQSIFGAVDKLIVYNNKFFILDKARAKKIFIFSNDGKFIRTIGNAGKGPGEYTNIEDFTIDEETKNIIVLCYPSTVITYDFTGQFIRQKKLSESALLWNICNYKDGYICSTNHQSAIEGNGAFLIFNYDKSFNLREKSLKVLPKQVGMPPLISNPLLKFGDEIAYFDFFTSSVHLNVNSKSGNTVCFDFEGQEVPLDLFANPQEFFSNQGDYCFFYDAIFADNILLSTFIIQGNSNISIVNFETNEKTTHKIDSWFPEFLFYQNNAIFSVMSPSRIIKGHDFFKAKNNSKYPIEENSNKVLLKLKVKPL